MKMTIHYEGKSYGNVTDYYGADVAIFDASYPEDSIKIRFHFLKKEVSEGFAGVLGGDLELTEADARKLATAILWHLEQPQQKKYEMRKEMHLKLPRQFP